MEKQATRKSFGEALVKLGAKREGIVVLDADLSCSVQTAKFAAEFPERHFNMGIAEQNMLGAAAGFATRGKIPFACTFSVFATGRPWEIIRNSICYPNLNVKILGSHAGVLTGEDGASHQALEDIAIMRALPNMKVVQPADHVEALSVMEKIVDDYGPTYLRVLRQGTPLLYSDERPCNFEFGKADVLFDSGKGSGSKPGKVDLCVFATGALVGSSLEAALKLTEEDGKKVLVYNMSSLKPIDEDAILEGAGRAKVCVAAEDHNTIGGLGSAVADVLAGEGVGVRLVKIGVKDAFGESGKPADLYKKYGFDAEGVYKSLRSTG
ncbi:transketolase family protein [Candidatus Peregrinibacteria bacterium]|nr:transketolase family protein [Candidatus Peregrinibacteria bacterium]MBT4147917.1 transketolase family protein [Candidatus Peregrinibacteria bacterium]MBT4456408.1 transketolase family protein [Candidatus Peregrinibacteria bacterium]